MNMNNVYNIFSGALVSEENSVDLKDLNVILNGNGRLTKFEHDIIAKQINESGNIIDICGEKDGDVIAYHDRILDRCSDRLKISLKSFDAEKYRNI